MSWGLVLLVAAAAIFLRVYAIDRLPPGLFGDEAVEGLDALDVMAGNWSVWFHAHLGREPLFVYLVALSYSAFGVTPIATRLPALLAGLALIPASFFFAREWARQTFAADRANRIAFLTAALVATSFWVLQMTRDAHRDILLPLVGSVGLMFLWSALRTGRMRSYVGAGAVLGLAIYTYSPGRFVGVLVAVFFGIELLIRLARARLGRGTATMAWKWKGLIAAGAAAIVVMIPLGLYFVQNPAQFSRRFESVSIFDASSPPQAFAQSVVGNLAQFVVPGAGYQSKHYNLPGKPVFDLWIAPWFLAGVLVAFARLEQPAYRFLVLWFVVMMTPAFLTADMVPKGVRALGVVPGVFIFPALAMDLFVQRFPQNWKRGAQGLVGFCLVGSLLLTAHDYFVAWAGLPELPLAFDADMVRASQFVTSQPAGTPVYVSAEVYRHPTLMLLGKRTPTTRYYDRSSGLREFDGRTTLVAGAGESDAVYVFVREQSPGQPWLTRLALDPVQVEGDEYLAAYRLSGLATPQHALSVSFNPLLRLVGYTVFRDAPQGIVLYWQVTQLPSDRTDIQAVVSALDAQGTMVTQGKHTFGDPPMEWALGDTIADWYALSIPDGATSWSIQLNRGNATWQSPVLTVQ